MTGGEVVKSQVDPSELVVVPGDEYALIEVKRRAHICCGCDTRNAVLAVNSAGVLFYLLMVISFSMLAGDTLDYDDDHVQSVMDGLSNAKIGMTIFTFTVGLISAIAAIVGAVNFNKIGVVVGGFWYTFEVVRSLFVGDFLGMIVAACFCYPHAVFYYELKNGVMSRENYPKEKVCCDCCCSC